MNFISAPGSIFLGKKWVLAEVLRKKMEDLFSVNGRTEDIVFLGCEDLIIVKHPIGAVFLILFTVSSTTLVEIMANLIE